MFVAQIRQKRPIWIKLGFVSREQTQGANHTRTISVGLERSAEKFSVSQQRVQVLLFLTPTLLLRRSHKLWTFAVIACVSQFLSRAPELKVASLGRQGRTTGWGKRHCCAEK